jgi:prenyltransferase beta subunit
MVIGRALRWLAANQSSDGSYGAFFEHETAAAAYALWLNNSGSSNAARAYSVLSSELNSSSSWFWLASGYGEADVPGAMLYSVAASHHLNLINVRSVNATLLEFQQSDGGFKGYTDAQGNAYESSVDTALALRALVQANAVNASSRQIAAQFLLRLQNTDGSFNLTQTIVSDPIYSQGPEPVSITALVLLALKDASSSYNVNEVHVSRALNFLTNTASGNFTASSDHKGHVYAASLSALAFNDFGRVAQAAAAVAFVSSNQNSDGGFGDIIQSHRHFSNPLDTAWGAIALQVVQPGPLFSSFLSPILFAGIIVAVGVVAVVGVVVVFLVVSRRARRQTAASGAVLPFLPIRVENRNYEKSPILSPDLESGSAHLTLPKFVRNCRHLSQAIRTRIAP